MILPAWVYPVAGAVLLSAGAVSGWKVASWRCEAAQAKALEKAAKQMSAAADKMNSASRDFEETRSNERNEVAAAQTEIHTIYKDRVIRPDCALDPAARSVLSEAIQRANSASGVTGKPVPDTP